MRFTIFAPLLRWIDAGGTKRDLLLSFMLGMLAVLAMPPVGLWPILGVCFPLLLRLLDKALTTRHAFWLAWLYAFGYFTAGLYWISAALFVDLEHNWWALPFAVMGLPSILAFYPALATAFWHRLAWTGPARVLSFAVLWALAEFVRGFALSGFPWNLWGYAWSHLWAMMQSASLFGLYGLTLLTILWALLPSLWGLRGQNGARAATMVLLLLALLLGVWGQGRLHAPLPQNTAIQVRVIQPNIAQTAKLDEAQQRAQEKILWDLTAGVSKASPQIIVWPETSLILRDTWSVRQLEGNIQTTLPRGAVLAAGLLDVGFDEKKSRPQFFNRVGFYNDNGTRLATYDKAHLVPFGEYLPLQDWWPVRPVAFQDGSFTAGDGIQTLSLPKLPDVSAMICYEVLFPGAVALHDKRPQWLLNVTNDAWYGSTSGPYQHLVIARTRAVEEGLPLVRAANSGISAMIDPLGRITEALKLDTRGVLQRNLPPALKPTLFARVGHSLFFFMLVLVWGVAWALQRRSLAKLARID